MRQYRMLMLHNFQDSTHSVIQYDTVYMTLFAKAQEGMQFLDVAKKMFSLHSFNFVHNVILYITVTQK